jgi:hypothetical protein
MLSVFCYFNEANNKSLQVVDELSLISASNLDTIVVAKKSNDKFFGLKFYFLSNFHPKTQ